MRIPRSFRLLILSCCNRFRYQQPKQLVDIASEQRNQALDGRGTFSVPDFLDIQKSTTTLEYVATFQGTGTIMTEGGDPNV